MKCAISCVSFLAKFLQLLDEVVAVPVTPCFAQPSVVASAVAVPSAHVPLALWTLPQGLIVSQWKCRAGPVTEHAGCACSCCPS